MSKEMKFLPFGEIYSCTKCGQQRCFLNGQEYSVEEFEKLSQEALELYKTEEVQLLSVTADNRLCFKCKEYRG